MKNTIKILTLLVLPLLLTACFSKPAPVIPTVSSEIKKELTQTPPDAVMAKTPSETPPVNTQKNTQTPKPDTTTDEMTKELDSLIDELVGF